MLTIIGNPEKTKYEDITKQVVMNGLFEFWDEHVKHLDDDWHDPYYPKDKAVRNIIANEYPEIIVKFSEFEIALRTALEKEGYIE